MWMKTVIEEKLSKTGRVDYIRDGILHRGANVPSILVNEQSELDALPKDYPPGTVAYTAGFKAMWQLGANGVWVSLM